MAHPCLRVGLLSSAIEGNVDAISSFRNDLQPYGAAEEGGFSPTFVARIIRVVCDMSPRVARQLVKMEEKKRRKRRKAGEGGGFGVGRGHVMSSIAPSGRREIKQFPGLAKKRLTRSVPLKEGFYKHETLGGGDKDFDIHARSRNKRLWDDDHGTKDDSKDDEGGGGECDGIRETSVIDMGKRAKSRDKRILPCERDST